MTKCERCDLESYGERFCEPCKRWLGIDRVEAEMERRRDNVARGYEPSDMTAITYGEGK